MIRKRKKVPVSIFVVCLVILGLIVSSTYFFLQSRKFGINTKIFTDQQPVRTQLIPSITPTITESPNIVVSNQPIVATNIPEKDVTPPKAFILSPEDRTHVRSGVKIVANVTDDVKVDRVEFYAGSSDYQRIGVVRQAPFEVIWIPSDGFSGYGNKNNIPIYIKAYDSSGNYGGSSISVYLDQ